MILSFIPSICIHSPGTNPKIAAMDWENFTLILLSY